MSDDDDDAWIKKQSSGPELRIAKLIRITGL